MKELLKPGYVVKLRRNDLFLVMQGDKGIYLSNSRGSISLQNFADDLTAGKSDLDIMCVYGYSGKADKAAVIDTDGREVIWERSSAQGTSPAGINSLNALVTDVHQNAVAHGWWDEERTFGDILALCHSELSEALEQFRDGKPMVYYYDDDNNISTDLSTYDGSKLEGIATELIDCVIRIFDYCGKMGINVEWVLLNKHNFNKTRSYKHGGKVM